MLAHCLSSCGRGGPILLDSGPMLVLSWPLQASMLADLGRGIYQNCIVLGEDPKDRSHRDEQFTAF